MKVGIIGASGYTGGEVLRLLLLHPKVEVVVATSREYAGEYIHRVHANLRGITTLQFDRPEVEKIAEKCEVAFISAPRGVSTKIAPTLLERGLRVVDLGPDFRLRNPEDYVRWYGWTHPQPELLSKATYGVPEFHRDTIKSSKLVACPGCTAVASMLCLGPAVKHDLIDASKIIVDVKMGSSGAGGKPSTSTHHAERFGVIRPYKPVGHRHTAEIEQELKQLQPNADVRVAMSAHAVNVVRGILSTGHGFLREDVDTASVWKAYRALYQGEPFIRLVRDRKGLYRYPDPKVVIGSNYCDIGFELDPHANRLVMLSAIDNLMKGAAGLAVQNMNIMLGIDEKTGLQFLGLHPV
ncbi:MAG: N-acetyl-gamma-glutamyl-phosphate reductase [Candidatus Bathyarchaeia archaeon]